MLFTDLNIKPISFINSINIYCVLGTVPGSGDTEGSKTSKESALMELPRQTNRPSVSSTDKYKEENNSG